MILFGAAIGWAAGSMVAGALVRVAISNYIVSKDFSAFTQDTEIS